jgi:hypothetical protein
LPHHLTHVHPTENRLHVQISIFTHGALYWLNQLQLQNQLQLINPLQLLNQLHLKKSTTEVKSIAVDKSTEVTKSTTFSKSTAAVKSTDVANLNAISKSSTTLPDHFFENLLARIERGRVNGSVPSKQRRLENILTLQLHEV